MLVLPDCLARQLDDTVYITLLNIHALSDTVKLSLTSWQYKVHSPLFKRFATRKQSTVPRSSVDLSEGLALEI